MTNVVACLKEKNCFGNLKGKSAVFMHPLNVLNKFLLNDFVDKHMIWKLSVTIKSFMLKLAQ